MIGGKDDLVAQGILRPSDHDWRVRIFLADGTERTVRVSPGKIDEAHAVERALRHAKVLHPSLLDRVEAERVAKSTTVAAFGIQSK